MSDEAPIDSPVPSGDAPATRADRAAPSAPPPPPTPPAPPTAPVDALVEQLKAGNALATEAAQAIDGAVQAAQEIAGSIPDAAPSGGGRAEERAAPAAPEVAYIEQVPGELRRLLAIEVPVIVQLGARRLTIGEVMRFSVGAIIEFHKSADEELELLVNNKTVGKGHAVKVGENFGIKISTISPVKETIRKLGGI